MDGILLEIITEAEVSQHFKECMMTGSITDIVQVVMLTACTNTSLSSSSAGITSKLFTQENILELIHTGIGK